MWILSGKTHTQRVGIQSWLKRWFRQQARDIGSGVGTGQLFGNAFTIQHVGELAQNIQVLVVLSRNRHQDVHLLAVVPLDSLGKLQYSHAGLFHMLAAFRRPMGDRDSVAQVRRGLGFTGVQAVTVLGLNQSGVHQRFSGTV